MTSVMIVENTEKPLWLAKKLLSEINYEIVFETENGYEAIEKYDTIKPDLVLLDLNPTKNNGLNIIQELKKKNREARIVIMTRNLNPKIIGDCLNEGASECIPIPFSMKDFVSILCGVDKLPPIKSQVKPLIIEES